MTRRVSPLGGISLVLRLLLELALLGAFLVAGIRMIAPAWFGATVGLVVAAGALVAWGAFIAPRARRRLADPVRLFVEIVLFGLAALALLGAGLPGWAAALAVVAAINIGALQALKLR